MLGASVIAVGAPFTLGYSFNAVRRVERKGLAYIALGLSVIEAVFVTTVLLYPVFWAISH